MRFLLTFPHLFTHETALVSRLDFWNDENSQPGPITTRHALPAIVGLSVPQGLTHLDGRCL